DGGLVRIGGHELREGDVLTIDGSTGRVYAGEVPLVQPGLNEDFETILGWADGFRRLAVRANADTPEDAARAREFGAEGIGLCRTGAARGGPGDAPRRARAGAPRGARPAPPPPAERLGGLPRGGGRAPRDDPAARPAVARVPAPGGAGDRREDARAHPRAPRGQ